MKFDFFTDFVIMIVTDQNMLDLLISLTFFFIDQENLIIKISKFHVNYAEFLLGRGF